MNDMFFPTLNTERTLLRNLLTSDAGAIYGIYSDAEAMKYRIYKAMESLDEAQKMIQDAHENFIINNYVRWAIESKETKKVVGSFLWRIQENEIGFALHKSEWEKGIMVEVSKEVINFLHSRGVNFIQAYTNKENIRAANLLVKLGFVHVYQNVKPNSHWYVLRLLT